MKLLSRAIIIITLCVNQCFMPLGQIARAQEVTAKPDDKASSFLHAIMAARSESDAPPRLTPQESNLFSLGSQTLVSRQNNENYEIRLGFDVLRLPAPEITNLEQDISYSVENGTVVLTHKKTGLRHEIKQLKAQSITVDQNFLYIYSDNGTLSVIQKDYIKEFAFHTSIPVFRVAAQSNLGTNVAAEVQVIDDTKSVPVPRLSDALRTELSSGTSTPISLQKGDVLISSQGEVKEVVGVGQVADQVFVQSLLLSFLCVAVNPSSLQSETFIKDTIDKNSVELDKIKAILADPNLKEILAAPENLDILSRLPTDALKRITSRVRVLRSQLPQQERVSLDAWSSDFEKHQSENLQRAERRSLGATQLSNLQQAANRLQLGTRSFLSGTGRFLKKVVTRSNVTKVTTSLAVLGGLAVADHLTGNQASNWALSLGAKLWNVALPDVLADPKLREPTIRTTLLLYLSLPIITSVGYLASKYTGWGVKKTLAVAGIRAYGLAQGILYMPLRYIARQKNIFPALVAGLSPAGNSAMVNSPWASDQSLAANREVLETAASRKNKSEMLAWLIAHSAVSGTENIDPLSLLATELNRGEPLSATQLQEWGVIAIKLQQELENASIEDLDSMLNGIKPESLNKFALKATQIREKLRRESNFKRSVQVASARFRQIWKTDLPKLLGYIGYESHRRLMTAEPSAPIYKHYLRKFLVDYTFGLAFYSLWGARADLKNPQDLVSDPQGPLGINKSHLADVSDWNLSYAISNPANLYLDYDRNQGDLSNVTSDENLAMQSRTAGFFETARHFMRTAVDLPRANYGYYCVRAILQTGMTLPAAMILGMFSRTVFMHQGMGDAFFATFWTLTTAMWAYAWPWIFVDRGITLHEEEVRERSELLMNIQRDLYDAINEKNNEKLNIALVQLKDVYAKAKKALPNEVGNLESVDEVMNFLRASLANPPLPQRPNERFLKLFTWVGSLSTTALATSFSVAAFNGDASWAHQVLTDVPSALALFGVVWVAQKAINRYWYSAQDGASQALSRVGAWLGVAKDRTSPQVIKSGGNATCRELLTKKDL